MLYMRQPINIGGTKIEGLWGLCRIGQRKYEEFLTEQEKIEYAVLKSNNRKREWLSARVALKKLLMDANLIESPIHCQIEKHRYGCPHVRVQKEDISMIMNCSISHKKGIASVCVSCSPEIRLGIDMETINERPWRVRKAFINRHDFVAGIKEAKDNYSILWACKEAASKVIGLGMLMDFKRLTIIGDKYKGFCVLENGKEAMKGIYFFFQDFVIAMCYQKFGTLDYVDNP